MPVVRIFGTGPREGRFGHDGGRCVFGRHGATQDQPVGDLGRSGRESVMAVDRFCRNAIGPPEWEGEAMGSIVWVQCTNLCRVYIKYIDRRARG